MVKKKTTKKEKRLSLLDKDDRDDGIYSVIGWFMFIGISVVLVSSFFYVDGELGMLPWIFIGVSLVIGEFMWFCDSHKEKFATESSFVYTLKYKPFFISIGFVLSAFVTGAGYILWYGGKYIHKHWATIAPVVGYVTIGIAIFLAFIWLNSLRVGGKSP